LYELERTWTASAPEPPIPVTLGARPDVPRPIRTLKDVHDCLDHYCAVTPYDRILNTAQHFSTDFDYRQVSDAEMSKALERRAQAGPEERDIYANYIIERYLQRLEQSHEGFIFQFSLGADPLPFETASRIRQTTLRQLGELIARHPKLNFQSTLQACTPTRRSAPSVASCPTFPWRPTGGTISSPCSCAR